VKSVNLALKKAVFAEGVWGGSKNRHAVHGDREAANRKIKVIFQEKTT